jgi:excisionase family DNA binding protein
LVNSALTGPGPIRLRLVDADQDIAVPRAAFAALQEALAAMADGESVAVLPSQTEISTQQAADALRVSRPFLVGLLESGQIPFRQVGTHRRVRAADLAAYLQQDHLRRVAAADALSAEAAELGLI